MFDKLKLSRKNDEALVVLPNTNIYEQDENIVLSIEIPGADKDSLDVNLEGNILMISAKKKKEEIPRQYQTLFQERQIVEYRRTFEINAEIDKENIDAEYENGILKITLFRVEKTQPKRIEIKV